MAYNAVTTGDKALTPNPDLRGDVLMRLFADTS